MTMELPILVEAKIDNDYITIDIKNYMTPGEVSQDIEITRTFRVLDVYMDGPTPIVKVKYFDNAIPIQLSQDDWDVVDGLWQTL